MQKKTKRQKVFNTDKRIRLGIWGLGRGMSFYETCALLNIDVVAGCDYNEHMRKLFLQHNPGAFVTDNADEFLARDMDAVLLATFCPAHADDAIRCLRAGKHVLSEVTAFHTMAEGVRLVEEVEKSGKIYNLAENYPFSAANMYVARKWKEGLFGKLIYAEYEYVHEVRTLSYTYIDDVPIQPGNQAHNWRSWLNYHYYCTHSLGPVMVITGERPIRVVSLPSGQRLAGYLPNKHLGMGSVAPSLIMMTHGGLVRNLMGSTTNDSHVQRIWGTLGSAELNVGHELQLRLGGGGSSPKFAVVPKWDDLGELAAKTGHGGGDFWVLYYFARQIFTGEPAPFDIYSACDVTIPGILALRSALENGKPCDVPDFRQKKDRDAWRNDNWAQERYDYKNGVFAAGADFEVTKHFTRTMKDLVNYVLLYRSFVDWGKVLDDVANPAKYMEIAGRLELELDGMLKTYAMARKIVDAYPGSDGAKVLGDMLEVGQEKIVTAPGFQKKIKARIAAIYRKFPRKYPEIISAESSPLLPRIKDIRKAVFPGAETVFKPIPYMPHIKMFDVRGVHDRNDGMVYIRTRVSCKKAGKVNLLFGSDGPVRVFFNRKPVACEPEATNPCIADQYRCSVPAKKGSNEIVFALLTNSGRAWGVMVRLD